MACALPLLSIASQVRDLLPAHPHLRVVLMSATLHVDLFSGEPELLLLLLLLQFHLSSAPDHASCEASCRCLLPGVRSVSQTCTCTYHPPQRLPLLLRCLTPNCLLLLLRCLASN